MVRRRTLSSFISLTLLLLIGPGAEAQSKPQRFIVQFQSAGASSLDVKSLGKEGIAKALSAPVIKTLQNDNSAVVELDAAGLANIKSRRDIRSIEPDIIYHAYLSPGDPYYLQGEQYGLNGTYGIDAEAAWDHTTGSDDVVVGIVDTGIDLNHPDLSDNLWVNSGEIPNNGIDDDGNGYIDDYNGYNFDGDNSNPNDDNEHGTHVSGTIGARGDNSVGVCGVNWRVKLAAIKVLDSEGSGYLSTIAEGIDYAVALNEGGVNIKILNMSLGGGYSSALERAVERAKNHGILIAAAAGNDGTDNDAAPSYPASFTEDNVIAVAATDSGGNLASFSNYGYNSVDIGAPGDEILSTLPTFQGSYGYLSGTSMATPHVAGAAALVWAANPNLTLSQVRSILLGTATQLDSLYGYIATGGLLNVRAAVNQALSSDRLFIVSGKVLQKRKKGLKGVTVSLNGSDGSTRKGSTDADGSFMFDNIASGQYTLKLKKRGFTFKASRNGRYQVTSDLKLSITARAN